MKVQEPGARFRLEKLGITKDKVETSEVGERGLERPEEYWVELSTYEADPSNPAVEPSDYIYELVDGVMKPGATIGNAGGRKRKAEKVIEIGIGGGDAVDGSEFSDLNPADKEIVTNYADKLKKLRDVNPPLSEPQFKSNIQELLNECHTFLNDLKTKKRSAQRRSNAEDPLVHALESLEEQTNEHVKILKCVQGSAQVDTTTSLIAMIDDAADQHGSQFNHVVIRKALKHLVNQDVQLADWDRLTTSTKNTIDSRFQVGPDNVTGDAFYKILMTQTFQKLIKLVLPWLDKAIDAARDVGAIPEADVISKWDVTRELSGIESFKPVMELITLIGLIGKDITYIRGGAENRLIKVSMKPFRKIVGSFLKSMMPLIGMTDQAQHDPLDFTEAIDKCEQISLRSVCLPLMDSDRQLGDCMSLIASVTDVSELAELVSKADAAYHNQVSLLAIVTVMNIICSKRWQKAVNGNSDPPENLKAETGDDLQHTETATEEEPKQFATPNEAEEEWVFGSFKLSEPWEDVHSFNSWLANNNGSDPQSTGLSSGKLNFKFEVSDVIGSASKVMLQKALNKDGSQLAAKIRALPRDFTVGDGFHVRAYRLISSDFALPQRRVRLYIVGFSKDEFFLPDDHVSVQDELEKRLSHRARIESKDKDTTEKKKSKKHAGTPPGGANAALDSNVVIKEKESTKWQTTHQDLAKTRV
ncbi:unnamed protein product [Durusdinium trenchii]|uniref:Uncharacterized protein n=1 Tax=Durusdinium trenchii TaxID=1381693 RepID=A0ABP0IYY7_9DINO